MTTTKDISGAGSKPPSQPPSQPPPATPSSAPTTPPAPPSLTPLPPPPTDVSRGTTLADVSGAQPPAQPQHRLCPECGGALPRHRAGCLAGAQPQQFGWVRNLLSPEDAKHGLVIDDRPTVQSIDAIVAAAGKLPGR